MIEAMTKYNKIFFPGLMLILSFLIMTPVVLADTPAESKSKNYGLDITVEKGMGISKDEIEKSDLPAIIGKIVGAGLALLGVIFFVILVYAGISWMMAMGKEEKINEAKDMIVAAILGLIVVLAAYAITAMVGGIFAK